MPALIVYGATLASLLVCDCAWLFLVAIEQYQAAIGPIMLPRPNLAAAAALYLILAWAIVYLAVMPGRRARSLKEAAARGAALGLAAYSTFDLTNLAVIKGWTLTLAATDMAWGTVLCAVAAIVGYGVSVRLAGHEATPG